MRGERHDEPLSGEELDFFFQYLHRYAIHDLDQWLNLRVGSEEFPAYVTLSRAPTPGADPAAYLRP